MKTRYVYTVTAESETATDLDADIEFFKGAMTDEPGEFIRSALDGDCNISVEMHVSRDGKNWETIYGDPR